MPNKNRTEGQSAQDLELESAILRQRAAELAQVPVKPEQEESLTILKFAISKELYGIEISFVKEVLAMSSRIIGIPGAPDHIVGILNIRGEIVPAVDMRKILGLDAPPQTQTNFLVVLLQGGIEFGLAVDEVSGMERIKKAAIHADFASLPESTSRFCLGMTEEGRLLLNGQALFADNSMVVEQN